MALTVDVALLGGDDDDDDVGWTWTVDFGRPLHHRQAQRKKEKAAKTFDPRYRAVPFFPFDSELVPCPRRHFDSSFISFRLSLN